MFRIVYWEAGSTKSRVALVPAESHNDAVYQFELVHRFALIITVMEG